MKATDTSIFINKLRLYAFHGVMPQERKVGGWYLVTLRVHYDLSVAIESDDVADTVNYATLCQLVEREMAVPSNLLEHVAGRIAQAVTDNFPGITELHLTLTKENPPMGVNCEGAGVNLHLIIDKTHK